MTQLNIGKMIKAELDSHPKTHTVQWFADQLGCKRPNAYAMFQRQSLDTHTLLRVCRILDHDFFLDISNALFPMGEKGKSS